MKNPSRFLLIASTAIALCANSSFAQDTRFYFKGDLGGNITHDTGLREFFGEPLASGTKIHFDPGLRLGVAGGYRVTDWFSGELETGIMANYIHKIDGATRVEDAVFSNIPLLVNARIQWPHDKFITPYIGGGVGGSFPVIDVDQIEIGETRMHGSDATAVFAYQGFAGVRFRLNQAMGLAVEYHYFHADGAEWSAEDNHGASSDKLRFAGTETHAFSIAFDWRF